jgi:hypothetical protein
MDQTYNNGPILKLAGFHPDVLAGVDVKRLRFVVSYVRQTLRDNPSYFKRFEPENGWGGYENVVKFIGKLDDYLIEAPDDYTLKVF